MRQNLHIFTLTLILITFSSISGSKWRSHSETPYQFKSDVDQYYSYLPATFIHQDLTFSFSKRYWLIENTNGKKLAKGSMGMSYMYAPFFAIGHIIALNSDYKADGYSKPYSLSIWFGTMFYFLFGMIFLVKVLDNFVNKWVSVLTVLLIFFGTNLLFYTIGSTGEMPHSYLFSLFSVFLYLTIKWHKSNRTRHLYLLAFVFGLIVIIRPVEILLVLFFFLYGVYSKHTLFSKLNLLKKNLPQLLIASFIFILPILPQLLYWKIYGGDWLVYSYGSDEKFFFSDPKIIDFLFSYRKGWLVYSPLMIFSLVGFFFMNKRAKDFKIAIPAFIIIIIYMLSSWWCWWYGGSFGMRAMIQYYALLAIPLAVFIQFTITKKLYFFLVTPIIIGFSYYGFVYNVKYKNSTIHWDSMTKDAYWYTFMKPIFSGEDFDKMDELIESPDYKAAQKGIR